MATPEHPLVPGDAGYVTPPLIPPVPEGEVASGVAPPIGAQGSTVPGDTTLTGAYSTDPTQAEGKVASDVSGSATTEVTLADLLKEQQAHRAEVAALRQELAQSRTASPQSTANAPTAEEALATRLAEIDQYPFYCPGCGALYKYQRECIGLSGAHPHPPIEVVSTDELKSGDPTTHTPAPNAVA